MAKAQAQRGARTSKGRKRNVAAGTIMTMGQAAAALGVSDTTLKDWRHKGCPGITSTGTNVAMIAEWLEQQAELRAAARYADASNEADNVDDIEKRILLEDLITKQIKNERDLGKLIPKDQALDILADQMTRLRSAFETLESKWSERFALTNTIDGAAEQLAKMREEAFSCLRAAACVGPVLSDDPDVEEDDE